MRGGWLLLLLVGFSAGCVAATPDEVVDRAPASDWMTVPARDLLVMEVRGGARVVIRLAPDFAPAHVRNIAILARRGWWDGGAVVRSQDGYVVQWAPRDEKAVKPRGYVATLPPEYERGVSGLRVTSLGSADSYADRAGFVEGWPVGMSGDGRVWLAHCRGMVGVARDMPPDTGDGQELYAVTGEAPRQLDRNMAVVGEVVSGMGVLTGLPHGTGRLGFYVRPEERDPIVRVVLASDLPEGERPRVAVMRTESGSFAAYLHARAKRTDPFFVRPAGGVALCNAPVPVRVE